MSGRAPTGAGPPVTAERVVAELRRRGLSVGTAESLTGGLVCAALTSVPGSSSVVRGGVVSYAADVKASVLGVSRERLAAVGAVDGAVAEEMAVGVCRVLACDVGLATTGVAGPDPADGQPVGTVYVAVAAPGRRTVRRLALAGGREKVRRQTVERVLRECLAALLLCDAGGAG